MLSSMHYLLPAQWGGRRIIRRCLRVLAVPLSAGPHAPSWPCLTIRLALPNADKQ